MSQASKLLGFVTRAVIAGLALAFVLVYLWPALAERLATGTEPLPLPAVSAPVSYADAVNRTAPAVVSIYTRSLQPQPVDPETQKIIGSRYLYRMTRDEASGVLLSSDGYILTNHHVISRARNIQIALWDGRTAPVRIVGSDPATDLAVLKDPPGNQLKALGGRWARYHQIRINGEYRIRFRWVEKQGCFEVQAGDFHDD